MISATLGTVAMASGNRITLNFAGNSLGLMPKAARQIVEQELDDWAKLGVDAHLNAKTPWYTYHEQFREPLARLAGARPNEVVCMNSLTVNLHLMMATFYRPTKSRFKILMEDPALRESGMLVELEHPESGKRIVPGLPVTFTGPVTLTLMV